MLGRITECYLSPYQHDSHFNTDIGPNFNAIVHDMYRNCVYVHIYHISLETSAYLRDAPRTEE